LLETKSSMKWHRQHYYVTIAWLSYHSSSWWQTNIIVEGCKLKKKNIKIETKLISFFKKSKYKYETNEK